MAYSISHRSHRPVFYQSQILTHIDPGKTDRKQSDPGYMGGRTEKICMENRLCHGNYHVCASGGAELPHSDQQDLILYQPDISVL